MLVKVGVGATHTNQAAGFSLIEMLIVVTIVAILGGMTTAVAGSFINRSKADGTIIATMRAFDVARNRAIAERRNFEVTFPASNRVVIERVEVPGPGKTVVADFVLENGLTFQKFTGVPDTPDAFGNATATDFDGTAPVMFTSDGSLVDAAGDVSNGTVFLGQGTDSTTARAITIFGVTGLIRSWTWAGTQWVE